MTKIVFFRLISIIGGLSVGLWFPLRWIGMDTTFQSESLFISLLAVLSATNLYLHFTQKDKRPKDWKSWLQISPLLDLSYFLLPTSLLFINTNSYVHNTLLLTCLLAIRHISKIRSLLDRFSSIPPIAFRLIPVLVTMPLLIHLFACVWFALGSGSAKVTDSLLHNYIQSFYWALTTLTTVGYGDIVPVTSSQILFTCFAQIIGVGVFGYILSNVAGLLARYDSAREHHMDNLDQAETFMKTHNTPQNLKLQVRNYYRHTWLSKKGYQDQTLLENLPEKLQSDLLLHINKSIIEKVPFFRGADQDLLKALMNRLQFKVLVPEETVFKINDPGDSLYFIQSGDVDIFSKDHQRIASLSDGSFFGEIALISKNPRTATAVSRSYCNMYYLSRDDFEEVSSAYPSFRQHLESVMLKRKTA